MEQTECKRPDLWNKLVAAADEYVLTAPLSAILRPEGDAPLVLTAQTARQLADRAAALEAELAEACRDRDRYLDAIDEACKHASKKGCIAGVVVLADVPRGGEGVGQTERKLSEEFSITCGDDCSECYYHPALESWYSVDSPEAGCPDGIIAAVDGDCAPVFGYCYRCGRQLGFDTKGAPTIGDSAAALEARADLAEKRLAALETRVADLQGVSDANDTLAVALDQERRHSAEVLSQRNQAIDHVRRLHARVADAAQLLGSISLTHPHLVPTEWAECKPEVKP